jgi:hypothetical protein
VIPIDRLDLLALVGMLQHEHFAYSGAGPAALRALTGLEQAITTDANTIALVPELAPAHRPGDDVPTVSGGVR